jgi:glutathione S-transferase
MIDLIKANYFEIGTSIIVIAVSFGMLKLYFKRKRAQKRNAYARDTVVLHQFPRGKFVPSMSPYCLKLETWLRMAEIKYENEFSYFDRSPKGKSPFITFEGQDIGDSHFCIEYLSKKLGKDLSSHLSLEQKSIARCVFKTVEESFHWASSYFKMVCGNAADLNIHPILFYIIKRIYTKNLRIQGYGRHTQEEVLQIAKDDLNAIETLLGGKPFLFGQKPCVEDAVIFAWTCQLKFVGQDGPLNQYFIKQCPNLMRHVTTIKETYWKDWDSCVKK